MEQNQEVDQRLGSRVQQYGVYIFTAREKIKSKKNTAMGLGRHCEGIRKYTLKENPQGSRKRRSEN